MSVTKDILIVMALATLSVESLKCYNCTRSMHDTSNCGLIECQQTFGGNKSCAEIITTVTTDNRKAKTTYRFGCTLETTNGCSRLPISQDLRRIRNETTKICTNVCRTDECNGTFNRSQHLFIDISFVLAASLLCIIYDVS